MSSVTHASSTRAPARQDRGSSSGPEARSAARSPRSWRRKARGLSSLAERRLASRNWPRRSQATARPRRLRRHRRQGDGAITGALPSARPGPPSELDTATRRDHPSVRSAAGLGYPESLEQSLPDYQLRAPGCGRIGIAFLAASATEVDAVYDRLTSLGCTGERAPWDALWPNATPSSRTRRPWDRVARPPLPDPRKYQINGGVK
jgi:hypothetical protein